jgi:hypothetical protein
MELKSVITLFLITLNSYLINFIKLDSQLLAPIYTCFFKLPILYYDKLCGELINVNRERSNLC